LKKYRGSNKKSDETKKSRKEEITGGYVKIIDENPNRCILCDGRFKSNNVKVVIGDHFRYAHMECVTRYSSALWIE